MSNRKSNSVFTGGVPDQPNEPRHIVSHEEQKAHGDIEWEIPVESVPLPSRGLIYDNDSFFKNKEFVEIKAMTAKEEDILLSQAYIKQGVVIEELIKSCIMNKAANPDDLIAGDRNALCVAIRITGYGTDYKASVRCPHCSHLNLTSYDLANLGIKRLEVEPVKQGMNLFNFTLPISKKNIHFKLLTGHDERARAAEDERRVMLLGDQSIGAITSNFEQMIVSVDGITDRAKIKNFIQRMPAYDSKKLRTYMSDIQPGIDMDVPLTCESCGTLSTVSLPLSTEFFWPRE